MKRSRLRNIVNKAKELNTIKDPFDSFKNSLPIGLDYYKDGGKYRLKAAWEAYGKPKDFKEARWNGLIETFDGDSFIMPSIGYNVEKDSYEYLNIGKENEIVNKDLRAWDNDVIPFIKELKYGGYIKKFNEEEGYWSYVKEVSNPEEEIGSFKKGGKKLILGSEQDASEPPTNLTLRKVTPKEETDKEFDQHSFDFGNSLMDEADWENEEFQDGVSEDYRFANYIKYMDMLRAHGIDSDAYANWTQTQRRQGNRNLTPRDYLIFHNQPVPPTFFKQGGQMNVIPEGALHARKNGMELAKEGEVTHKGVPVVDNDGNQQAEIERNEIIFNKDTTDTIEKAYKEFYQEDTTKARQDELAIKIGKFLSKQILENTEDRTGLIEEVKEKM